MKKLCWIALAGIMVGASAPLQAEDLHGSIAFSQDEGGGYAWGIAWSFDSSAGAQVEALGQCRAHGGTRCAEVGWFREACGALALGDDNGYGTGWGATTAEAERDALAQCRVSDDDCRIEVGRCSQSEEAGGRGRQQEENMTAGRDANDTRLASASPVLEPKCGDGGAHSHCWRAFSNKPRCHAFAIPPRILSSAGSDLGTSVSATWSGQCANGGGGGQGTVAGDNLIHIPVNEQNGSNTQERFRMAFLAAIGLRDTWIASKETRRIL